MIKPSLFDSIFGIISPILILVLIIPFAYGQDVICDALECPDASFPFQPEPFCTTEVAVVCGSDVMSYGNACLAEIAGVRVVHNGTCLLPLITEEDAIKISQELGFERIDVKGIVSVGTFDSFETVTSQSSPLTGIIEAVIPQLSITQDFGEGLDVTDGTITFWLEFTSNSLTNDLVVTSGFIDVNTNFQREGTSFGECGQVEQITDTIEFDYDEQIQIFTDCIELQQQSKDFIVETKEVAFAGREIRDNGVVTFLIFTERLDNLLKQSNGILEDGEYYIKVDLAQLTFTANGISYFLNFQDIPFTGGGEFITLRDSIYSGIFIVDTPVAISLEIPVPEIELIDQKVDTITTPVANETVVIVTDDFTELTLVERITKPITDFFQSIASFFQGLFGGGENGENGGELPDGVALCIDGIYFGVCTGDQHFDSDQACFGLTTQQCFDQCNVIGTTCRIG